MNIQGKVALITGASSGIGEGTARALAKRGVRLGLAARRLDRLAALVEEIRAVGGEAIALQVDVTDPAAVRAAAGRLVDTFGSIDIAVNNAGLMPASDLEALKTDEWRRMVDVNVGGLLNTVAAVLPHMIARKSGHIVNMSSIAGRKVFQGLSVYCATKHAVAALSDGMRMELAPKHNIRVTCVQPGAVDTELFEHVSDANYRASMEGLREQMKFISAAEIGETIAFALEAPAHVDLAEVFIMPTRQPW